MCTGGNKFNTIVNKPGAEMAKSKGNYIMCNGTAPTYSLQIARPEYEVSSNPVMAKSHDEVKPQLQLLRVRSKTYQFDHLTTEFLTFLSWSRALSNLSVSSWGVYCI